MKAALLIALIILATGCVQQGQITTSADFEKRPIELATSDNVLIKGDLYFPKTGMEKYPVVILAHQLNGDRKQWDNFIPLLIEKNYSVIAYDMRGLGQSTRYVNGTNFVQTSTYFDDMPKDVAAIINFIPNQTRIDKTRIAIVGASVGANVAYISIGRYPAIKAAVAMSPSSQRLTGVDIGGLRPHTIFFMADSSEAASANILAANTGEPKEVMIYKGLAHGVELLNNPLAVNDIFGWLSKYL